MFTRTKKDPLPYPQQWGSEKNVEPLSRQHAVPSDFMVAYSRIAIVLTILFWLLYASSVVLRQLIDGPQNYDFTIEAFGYALIVTVLTLSALTYLINRQGALQTFKKHRRVPQRVLDEHFSKTSSSVTVLVPSYNEEILVVRKTLLSAALQEQQNLRVVLLLDDKPHQTDPTELARITATKALASDIETL